MIAIVAQSAAWGRAWEVKRAFALGDDVSLICADDNPPWRNLGNHVDCWIEDEDTRRARRIVESARLVWVIGAPGLDTLARIGDCEAWESWASNLPLAAWWVDTQYLFEAPRYNALLDQLGVRWRFAMPDLLQYTAGRAVPLLHPFAMPELVPKAGILTILHSPGSTKRGLARKGTDAIERAVERARALADEPVRYERLVGVRADEVMAAKLRAHIVIDQMPAAGLPSGLGQSGEEGLAAGCVVFSKMFPAEATAGYFQHPPVQDVATEDALADALVRVLRLSAAEREELMQRGRQWAEATTALTPWRAYVMSHLAVSPEHRVKETA